LIRALFVSRFEVTRVIAPAISYGFKAYLIFAFLDLTDIIS